MRGNLTEEQRLQKAVMAVMAMPEYAALNGILMIGTKTVCETTPTAKTNGRDEWYGRKFIKSISDPVLRWVILHECYHKMYRHLETWKHLYRQDADRANRACDYVINGQLAKDIFNGVNIAQWEHALHDPQYDGMDSEQVFRRLPPSKGGKQGGGGQPMDEHDWEGAEQLSDEDKHQLERDVDTAIRQGVLAAGKMGARVPRSLEELMQAKVNWRDVLREFITSTCAGSDYSTWRRPNRRFVGMRRYMPSGITEQVRELVLAVDTSFSVGQSELAQFLGEVKGICEHVKPERVRLLYWGTAVVGDEVYDTASLSTLTGSTKPVGGGGTDPGCIPAYLTEKAITPDAVVVLTDGHIGNWGVWGHPLLWCIVNNGHARPPVGKAVHVDK